MSARDLRIALIGAFVLGVLLRLAFVGTQGIGFDVGTFRAWAERLRDVGPGAFYAPGYFSDYPPGYLYVLWLIASVLGGMPAVLVKAISIPFDVAIAVVLYRWTLRNAGEWPAVGAAGLYLLNPGLVLAGTYWGQMDAVGTLPFLLAVAAAAGGRHGVAGALGGLAAMVKPQFGLALVVVWAAAAVLAVRDRRPGPLVRSVLAAVAVVTALAIPFRMGLQDVVELVERASRTYEVTSLFAYNLWAILADFWNPDEVRFLALTYQQWGVVLFAVGIACVTAFLWRELPRAGGSDGARLGLFLAAGTLAVFAFYLLPTRVHERYLFPAFALLAPFAAVRRRALAAYLALAVVFFLSVFHAFTRYPEYTGGVVAPVLLEETLYRRPGVILLSLLAMGAATALAWTWVRERAYALVSERPYAPPAAVEPAALPQRGPGPLRVGSAPTRLDLKVALLLALLVLLTRGARLDWPRDMYFDEVYHARTAMELLAAREPYEWTHPHLAKELMALSVVLFGNVRAVGPGPDVPPEVTALAGRDGEYAYGLPDGSVWLVERDGRRELYRNRELPATALALDDRRVAIATDRSLVEVDRRSGAVGRGSEEREPTGALALAEGLLLHATSSGVTVLIDDPKDENLKGFIAVRDVIAIAVKRDRSSAYLASADGKARVVDLTTRQVLREWDAAAPIKTMTVVPEANRLFLGDASEPIVHSIDLESGAVERVSLDAPRTTPFRGPPKALATSPRTRLTWVLGQDGLVALEPHGVSAFAVVREAAGAEALAIDDTRDRVIAAVGIVPVEISSGGVAFAWRLPGVLAAGVLAFFLYLLTRRLFAARAIAVALALLVLIDGALFAQARIAMNDVYVGAAIVAGWYFVVAALQAGRRPWLDLLLAGTFLGVGLAAKWAAGPAILAVGLVSLVVTARAFVDGRPGSGGPLDLLARRGANAALLAFAFVVVPLAIYFVSYVPWFGLGHELWSSTDSRWTFRELQRQMLTYHSQLAVPHPAGSPWWSWPLDLKPVYWQYQQVSPEASTYIYDTGNLFTWWAGIPAMAYVLYQAGRTRAWHLAILALAFLTQYAAWIPVTRVLFQYHFFTALPFYLVGLAAGLGVLWERPARRAWVAGLLVAGTLWFAHFYPWLSALPIPHDRTWLYFWLPTWQYGCQFYPAFRCEGRPEDVLSLVRANAEWFAVALAIVAFAILLTRATLAGLDYVVVARDGGGQALALRRRLEQGLAFAVLAGAFAALVALVVLRA